MKTEKNSLIRVFVLSFCLLAAGTVFAASDAKSQAHTPAGPKAAATDAAAGASSYAPHLPGWIMHLPADKQEIVKKIWLTDGRSMYAYKQWLIAKRHELSSLVAMPGADEKAVSAVIKEIANTEEKLLTAKVAFARKLEKEGIPAWGHLDMMDHGMMGEGGMMGGMGGMMGGKGMACMSGMKDDMGSSHKPAASGADAAKPASGGTSH